MNHGSPKSHQVRQEPPLTAREQFLLDALRGLSDMYARTWDRVDGALVMMPDSIERFEMAHQTARVAIAQAMGAKATGDQP